MSVVLEVETNLGWTIFMLMQILRQHVPQEPTQVLRVTIGQQHPIGAVAQFHQVQQMW